MRVSIATFAVGLLLAIALPVRAEVTVRVEDGRIDVRADDAPLSEVLRHLAEHTGMKVIYDGAKPRLLVTASLSGRTPVEAVHDLLKDRKLNYALAVEASGRVATLIIVDAGGSLLAKGRFSTPAPPAKPAPVIGSLLDLLELSRSPLSELVREQVEAGAPRSDVKAEDVLPLELLERMPGTAEPTPAEIPEGSLLRLLLPPGQPPASEPRAPAASADKPAGAAVGDPQIKISPADPTKTSPVDPAKPPLR